MNRIKLFEDFLNSSELNIYDKPKFVEVLEETIYPSSFICSYVASAIKMLEGNGVKIYGFSYDENPTSVYFSEEELQEGHHFAVLDERFIIDPWIYEDYNRSVFDLHKEEDRDVIKYIYGDKDSWTDITPSSNDFKKLFSNKYQTLLDFYNKHT
jgi:hypothetical protein